MKKLVILAVLAIIIAAVVAWQLGLFEPAAAKAYRDHRSMVLEGQGFSKDMVSSMKWSLEIESCETSGGTATVTATQKTATIPPNAASFAFATIITTRFEARLEEKDSGWEVTDEQELSKQVSTYEDRRDR